MAEDSKREPVPGGDPTRSAPGLGPHETDPAAGVARETTAADAGRPRTTKAARVWIMLAVATVLLTLLIIFIAENSRSVTISFLGASGHISLALALLIAAVVGVAVTLLAGTARILQLRLEVRRHRRRDVPNRRRLQPR